MIPIQNSLLKTYLKRLTNLNSRNKSLVLSGLPSEQFLDIHDLDFIDTKSSFEIIVQLIAQKNTIRLCEIADPRFEKVNEMSKKLRKIARTERFIAEERGAEDLYIGWPFVRGKFMDGTVIHGPLVFFPVSLEQTEKYWQLRRRPEPATLNRSFLLAFSHFNQIQISDELLETNLDELDKDVLNFRTELYELLKNSPVSLNFNQDLFQNKLNWFDAQKTQDLDLLEKNGELKLFPEAVLGIFPQAGSFLVPDYEALIEAPKSPMGTFFSDQQKSDDDRLQIGSSVVRITNPDQQIANPDQQKAPKSPMGTFFSDQQKKPEAIKESETFTAFPQDATQELALTKIKQGELLVVQGPPGSGKSQLIANLISDFTARGKQVLLVCQKRVALDVVYDRLKEVGAENFVALIHDFKNDRAALYKQLSRQIEEVEEFKKQNYTLDSVLIERQFLQASRAIDQAVSELDEFKKALFDESICGLSVKELYLTSDTDTPQIDLKNEYKYFKFNTLQVFEEKLKAFLQYDKLIPASHFWYERVSFAKFGFEDLNQIKILISEIPEYIKNLNHWQKLATEPTVNEDLKTILAQLENLDENVWRLAKLQNEKINNWWENVAKSLNQNIAYLGDECRSEDLKVFVLRLDKLIEARQSFLKWPFYQDKSYFKILTAKLGLGMELYDLLKLKEKLERRLDWEKVILEIENILDVSLLKPLPSQTIIAFEGLKNDFEIAQKLNVTISKSDVLIQENSGKYSDLEDFKTEITKLKNQSDEAIEKYKNWRKYLTEKQVLGFTIYDLRRFAARFTTVRRTIYDYQPPTIHYSLSTINLTDFDLLVEADKIKESFTDVELEVVNKLIGKDDALACFQNSLRLAWLQHIEDQNPILRAVSSLKMSQLEESLQQNILLKQELSREILRLKLREQTYQELEFNRLKNRVTFRELYHQTTKKRKIWSVRKLLENHSEEIFKLVPCWLTSPEAASAIFPLTQGLFDLVIFDEASQCYAEYGIPALYRSKQFVIAGDSKQLTPTDLYRIRLDIENEDESPDNEIDSLLDLATQYIPQTTLQGHYRSQSLDLISFSNQHFYQNRLQLLPHFDKVKQNEPAIKYIKVEGEWKNNSNRIEAEKVWELVAKITEESPEKSIGIVTFNYQQQHLIQEIGGIGNNLFIKNIENVQGDERDIIIFSVGYAPDIKGKVKAQFGSLNAQGGENRLNVAITRAKESIYLITSVLPNQLEVENTAHEGPKLFKKYLEYALEVSEGRFVPNVSPPAKYQTSWFLKNKLSPLSSVHSPQSTVHKSQFIVQSPHLAVYNPQFPVPSSQSIVQSPESRVQSQVVLLTDDDVYFESISAKESHAYLPLQLRQKKWLFQRVWSREWWRKTLNNL